MWGCQVKEFLLPWHITEVSGFCTIYKILLAPIPACTTWQSCSEVDCFSITSISSSYNGTKNFQGLVSLQCKHFFLSLSKIFLLSVNTSYISFHLFGPYLWHEQIDKRMRFFSNTQSSCVSIISYKQRRKKRANHLSSIWSDGKVRGTMKSCSH